MNRIPRILPLPVPSVLSRPRLRRVLLLPALLLVVAACSGDDEPPMPAAPAEDLQEVTLYLSLPALSDSAAKRLGDPGTAQEETDDWWNTLVLFIVYLQLDETVQEVRCETLTQAEYAALPPSAAGSPYKQYTLNVPAGTVAFYGLTYYSPATGENYPGAAALGKAIKVCTTKKQVEALSISNYYPYDENTYKTGEASKFCSVASGYYQNADGENSYVIDYSSANADPTRIPTLTLRRLAAKIDVQWDAEAAYSEGGYVSAAVSSFEYCGSAEGRVFPELNTATSPAEGTTEWTFYNRTPISLRNGRQYHYTFPDGQTKAKVVFKVATKKENDVATERTYTMTYAAALQRATWYKVNATVRGNAGTTTGEQGDWTITPSSN